MPLSNYGISLADVYKNEDAMLAAKQDRQIRQAQLSDIGRKDQEREILRDVYKQNYKTGPSGKPALDYEAAAADVAQRGLGEFSTPISAAGTASRKGVLAEGDDAASVIGSIFGGAQDQIGWDRAKKMAVQRGVPEEVVSQIPDYSVEVQDQLIQASMKPEVFIKSKKKELELPSNMDTLLGIRASGQETGVPFIDQYSPDMARSSLAEKRQGLVATDYTSPTGDKTRTFTPKKDLLKGGQVDMGKDLTPDVEKLSKHYADSQIGRALPAIQSIDSFMAKHPKELPGVGILKNIGKTEYFKTDEGKQFNAAVRWLYDTDLKVVSGGAVTDNEAERAKIRNAMSVAHTAEDYRRVYKSLIKPLYMNTIEGMRGGYSKNVKQQFTINGGPDIDAMFKNLKSDSTKNSWEDDQFMYRRLSDGSVQRKKK